MTSHRIRTAVITVVGALVMLIVTAGATAGRPGVALSTTIASRPVAGSSDGRPVSMSPRPTELVLRVTNGGSSPIEGRTVRFSSTVLGLDFFAYEVAVDIRVPPGATEERQFSLDLSSLKGQATGLLPASIGVLDGKRHKLASQQGTVDVDGSKLSLYGIFGLVLFLLTAVGLVEVLLALSRHRLSTNRMSRGIRFLLPGIGLGLTLVIGSSVFSVFAPRITRWLPIVLIAALVLFAVGYLSPTPEDGHDDGPTPSPDRERSQVAAGRAAGMGARGTLPPGGG